MLACPHALCSGYSLLPVSLRSGKLSRCADLSDWWWSTAFAVRSRSCRTALLACQVGVKTQRGWGKRRHEHPREGADVSGTGLEKWVDYIPSREQLVQEKGLIHTCLHPLTLQRLAQRRMRRPNHWRWCMLCFSCLGSLAFLQAASFPFPSLQAAAKSTAQAPAPTPFHLEVTVYPWQLMGQKRQDRRWLFWEDRSPHTLFLNMTFSVRTQIVQTETVLFPQLANALALT